jgi:hypothetical protein
MSDCFDDFFCYCSYCCGGPDPAAYGCGVCGSQSMTCGDGSAVCFAGAPSYSYGGYGYGGTQLPDAATACEGREGSSAGVVIGVVAALLMVVGGLGVSYWARAKRKLCFAHSKVTAYQPEDPEAAPTLGSTRGPPPGGSSLAPPARQSTMPGEVQAPILVQAQLVERPVDEDAGNHHPELIRQSIRDLRRQAESLGIEREKIEDARDADDPKVRGTRLVTR